MKEYLTDAVVLNLKSYREHDRFVDLYTKNFGRLGIKVPAGRKILSKLSQHLDIGNFIKAKFVQKSQLTLVDALAEKKFRFLKNDIARTALFFRLLFLIRTITPEAVPDLPFWHFLLRSLHEEKLDPKNFLKLLGYSPALAECDNCRSREINSFYVSAQIFLCRRCGLNFPANELICI